MSSKQNLYLDWKQEVTKKKKASGFRQPNKEQARTQTQRANQSHTHTHRRQTRGNTGPPPETSW